MPDGGWRGAGVWEPTLATRGGQEATGCHGNAGHLVL